MLINLPNFNIRRSKLFLKKIYFPGGMRLWVTFLCLFFVGSAIFINSGKLAQLSLNGFALSWLILSILISFFSLLVNGIAWKSLLYWLGYSSYGISLIPLFLSSNLLKYLPGGIWHFVERIRVLKVNLGAGKALASVLLEPFLMVSAALMWVPLGGWQSGIGLLSMLPAICLMRRFREPLIKRLENFKAVQLKEIFNKTQLDEVKNDFRLERDDYPLKVLLLEMLFVLLRFGGFWCCLNAFSLESNIPTSQWMSAFSISWSIGLVVPAAPGGIGVFEAAMLIIVGNIVPKPPLLASLLCYRFVSTVVDLLAAASVLIRRKLIILIK